MKRLLAALVLLYALPVFGSEDSTAPTIGNVSALPTATNTSAAQATVGVCAAISDAESGLETMHVSIGPWSFTQQPRPSCQGALVSGLPTCNAGAAGLCRQVRDCVSSDTCSSGGGSTVETVRCSGSAWTVMTTSSNPSTNCTEVQLPRWGPGGTFDVSVWVCDRIGNCSAPESAGTVEVTP